MFIYSYFYPIFAICVAILCVGGKIAISIEKRNAKRRTFVLTCQPLMMALPLVNNHQPGQNDTNRSLQVPMPMGEMGQIEGPNVFQANRSRWNVHLCSTTSYILLILWFFPILLATSSKTFLNYINGNEMLDYFESLNDQEKMQLKDNFLAILTNFIYPIVIYAYNKKLKNHALDCLNLN